MAVRFTSSNQVDIPAGAKVTVAVIDASPAQPPLGSNSPALYALLGERFNSGDPFAAARHNENQPYLAP